jgi:outer membrane receptor for ferrienterochelin and colicins
VSDARPARRPLVTALLILLGVAAPGSRVARGQAPPAEKDIDSLDFQTLLNTPIDVWTATKTTQASHHAPAIITTVTREQIAVWGYRTMAELLGHVLGFFVVDDHISPNLAVRGSSGGLYADSNLVKVLIDGHSVSFSSTGGNGLGPELIPLSAVERVEIIRGPASALFGADAFLGVVNIQTRQGQGVNGASARVSAGRVSGHSSTDVDVAVGAARGVLDVMVAFRRHDQDLSGLELPPSSPAPSIPAYNFGARQASGLYQESTSAILTAGLRPTPGTLVELFAYYTSMQRGAEFGSLFQLAHGYNLRATFSENRVSQWQLRSGLLWEQTLGSTASLSVRGSYFQGGPEDDNRLEVGSEFYYVRRHYRFRGVDFDGLVEWNPRPTVRLVAGGSVFVDDEQLPSRIGVAKQAFEGVRAGQVVEAISVHRGDKTFVNLGGYLQGSWDLHPSYLGLTGGLRYDHHNVYGWQLSRRLGLVSSPRPQLHVKLLHGTAFEAPSPFLLYATPSAAGDVVGNASLRPQYVNTFELQLAYDPWPSLSLSTTVAYSLLRDKTEFIQQGINRVARNVARAATVSWENLVELRHRDWLRMHLSLELQRTVQRTGQEGYVGQVVGDLGGIYPRVMVHGGVATQPSWSPLRAAVQASFIGQRRPSGNNILLNGGVYRLDPYLLLDATLSTVGFHILRDDSQEVSLSLSGKNLLEAHGPAPGFAGVDYPLTPRSFFLQVNLAL